MSRSPLLLLLLLLLLAVECEFLFVPSESSRGEVSGLIEFKRGIFEDPMSVMADWDPLDRDPCGWTGVICSKPRGPVVSLNLSSSSLKGFLAPELSVLHSLEELILDNNLLLGTIPKHIGLLKNLTMLDLSVNHLSGPIPADIVGLSSIKKIDLHSNGLTGSLPNVLGNLATLVELRLDRNRLTGAIIASSNTSSTPPGNGMLNFHNNDTGLCQLPKLKVADFSYNFFVGKIPPCLKYLPRSSFQGNCFLDEYSIKSRSSQICSSKDTSKHSADGLIHKSPHHLEWLLIFEITTGILLFVFLLAGAATVANKCKEKSSVRKKTPNWKDLVSISIDGELLKNVPKLSRQDLEVACEDFSNIIGSSPDSVVYKGTLKNGPEIAVVSVRIPEDQWTGYLEIYFQAKAADLSRLNHENTAKLMGYCRECDPFSRMLVFEYASNGTLYEHLHYGYGYHLSWYRRMKIAVAIACGLRYLHTELQPPFTIYELNSSSVYLTEDLSPKLVDFESWKLITSRQEKKSGYITDSSFNGFMGSLEQRQVDVQGNTFAFGVLILEIISGRPAYCKERGSLVNWAMGYLRCPEEIGKLLDPELKDVKADDLAVLCSVVSLCIEPDPSKRPSMQIIAAVLQGGIDLSAATLLKESSLSWADLALSP